MKKILIFLTAIFSIFGLASCGGNNNPTDTGTNNNGTTENGGNSGNENNDNAGNNGNTGENTEGEQNKPEENLILGKYTVDQILEIQGLKTEEQKQKAKEKYTFVDQKWVEENIIEKKYPDPAGCYVILSTFIDEDLKLDNNIFYTTKVFVCFLYDDTLAEFKEDKELLESVMYTSKMATQSYKTEYYNWASKFLGYGAHLGKQFDFDENHFLSRWHDFLRANSRKESDFFKHFPNHSLNDVLWWIENDDRLTAADEILRPFNVMYNTSYGFYENLIYTHKYSN